ncbi:aconitate hydratase [bacterium]|nr:aconitate hydratase [bacterium]
MGLNLTRKILSAHLVSGKMEVGNSISIRIDHTLTQDATGTMAYLEFERLGLDRVKAEKAISYADHNMLQADFRNQDDHKYLESIAKRFGIYYSRPGNGICHQVNLERFDVPGKTLIGSDSHTPTGGGIGMISIGAGGLDVALAMAGEPYTIKMPKIVNIHLKGELQAFVSAKDVALYLLSKYGVKGGRGRVFEYTGEGLKTLNVPQRATITNMGTEMGLTTSIFPSDKITLDFLKKQNREKDWIELGADQDATYDEVFEVDLSEIEPMVAKPHSPGNIAPISEVEGQSVDQVIIGSCTNSSYTDLVTVAKMLDGKKIAENISAGLLPGSRQILTHLSEEGWIKSFVKAGVRILESACGPCIGMGFAPGSNEISVRTFNRNFLGRSGTKSASVFLTSPEVAAACMLIGKFTDPRKLGIKPFTIKLPKKFIIDDSMIIPPLPIEEAQNIKIVKGPNIKPLPLKNTLPDKLNGEVLIKVGEDITTDHIMPAGAQILPFRSNIPEISKFVFRVIDEKFYDRAMAKHGGFIVAGENYGQGSSREHAAIAPSYLGVKAVIVKSFSRIHLANLINFGIVPLEFKNKADYDTIDQGDKFEIDVTNLNKQPVKMKNFTKDKEYELVHTFTKNQVAILKEGGKLQFVKKHNKGE